MSVDHALKIALAANEEALNSDGRLNAKYILPRIDEYYLGQLLYFLMLSVAYEGELLMLTPTINRVLKLISKS